MYTELAECDDVTLLLRARGADRVAFGELVRRHQRAALRVAAVITGSTSEAEDIVQDSFVDVHRNLGSYRERNGALVDAAHRRQPRQEPRA